MKDKLFDCIVAAGTTEAHEAIEVLLRMNMRVLATVATQLGGEVLEDLTCDRLVIEVGRKTQEDFEELIDLVQAGYVIDATHPFATEVTRTLKNACASTKLKNRPEYIRYVREDMDYSYKKIIPVPDAEAAAEVLKNIPGNFLLTTGANTVPVYKKMIEDFNERGFVRVLNTRASIDRCQSCGIDPAHIIAKNPPFSENDNDDLISRCHIKAMVSKDSGVTGGLPEKIASAKKAGIPVILIERPVKEQGICSPEELRRYIKEVCSLE